MKATPEEALQLVERYLSAFPISAYEIHRRIRRDQGIRLDVPWCSTWGVLTAVRHLVDEGRAAKVPPHGYIRKPGRVFRATKGDTT